ncbi:hypothetical protein JKF63_00441 [Porcisia hertigi]|uniref:Uncharacterized protein n=1 Tax=Porcisia hertigi TaxID=2761500 RepID=A0A836HBM5_9TRYP|nr:hypothetical protein JKF63_00441 [Porcisia hertigi]
MNLQQASRGIEEWVHTLGVSLNRFKGASGLQRLVTTGELSLLSLFGEFERTRDENYEKRSEAVSETRQCLLQLADDFDGVAKATEKLISRMNLLLGTLERFHRCCDTEVDDCLDANDPDFQQQERDFQQIRGAISQLKRSFESFNASKDTCTALTRAAITQMEDASAATSCDVAAALTDFDRQRRRVEVKGKQVGRATSSATSREDSTVQLAEFNYLRESQALEGLGRKYIDSLGNAMKETHFALEMSSMTGWASSNVFFAHLGQLFNEMSESGKAIAANLLSIKNSQKVSHKLTEEKRRRLRGQRAAATATTATNPFGEDAGASSRVSSPLVIPPQLAPSTTTRSSTDGLGCRSVDLDSLFE